MLYCNFNDIYNYNYLQFVLSEDILSVFACCCCYYAQREQKKTGEAKKTFGVSSCTVPGKLEINIVSNQINPMENVSIPHAISAYFTEHLLYFTVHISICCVLLLLLLMKKLSE